MGCGASNSGQSPVVPAPLPNAPTTTSTAVKETPKKGKNDMDSSIRGSNLQASSTGKLNNSKSAPKVNASPSKNHEKPATEKTTLNSSKVSTKEEKKAANDK